MHRARALGWRLCAWSALLAGGGATQGGAPSGPSRTPGFGAGSGSAASRTVNWHTMNSPMWSSTGTPGTTSPPNTSNLEWVTKNRKAITGARKLFHHHASANSSSFSPAPRLQAS